MVYKSTSSGCGYLSIIPQSNLILSINSSGSFYNTYIIIDIDKKILHVYYNNY